MGRRMGCVLKRGRRYAAAALAVFLLLPARTVYGESAGEKSGWKQENGAWRHYRAGEPERGWIFSASDWYFLDRQTGFMRTGWFRDEGGQRFFLNPVSDGRKGRMLSGWQWIEGRCYYFDESPGESQGRLFISCVTPDGYSVDGEGRWVNERGLAVLEPGRGLPAAEPGSSLPAVRSGGGGRGASGRRGKKASSEPREPEKGSKTVSPQRRGTESNAAARPSDEISDGLIEGGSAPETGKKASPSGSEAAVPPELRRGEGPVIVSFVKPESVRVRYLGTDPLSYSAVLPAAVSFVLSDSRRLSLKVASWRFFDVPREEAELIAAAEFELPERYSYLRDSLVRQSVELPVYFERGEAAGGEEHEKPESPGGSGEEDKPGSPEESGEPGKTEVPEEPEQPGKTEEPEQPGESQPEQPSGDAYANFSGYEEIELTTAEYIGPRPGAYTAKLPKTVTYLMENGRKLPLRVDGWAYVSGRVEAGGTVTYKALIYDLPEEYRYKGLEESFEAVTALARLKLVAPAGGTGALGSRRGEKARLPL